MEVPQNITNSWNSSFFDAFDNSQRDERLDDFPFMSAMWPTVYMWLAYPILHVLPRSGEHCRQTSFLLSTSLGFSDSAVLGCINTSHFLVLIFKLVFEYLNTNRRRGDTHQQDRKTVLTFNT